MRRTIHRVGLRQYPDLFEVKQADTLAKNRYKRKEKLDYLEEYRRIYQEILDRNQCLTLKDLAVDGKDLIQEGMEPGKELGTVLEHLLDHVLEVPEDNTREKLLELLKTERKAE